MKKLMLTDEEFYFLIQYIKSHPDQGSSLGPYHSDKLLSLLIKIEDTK